jgi:hypothetical protein
VLQPTAARLSQNNESASINKKEKRKINKRNAMYNVPRILLHK